MNSKALTPSEYMTQLPEDRKDVVQKLRQTILDHIDSKFQECMNYGMLGYVVPFTIYPDGYHCNPKLPLPFMNLASQKKLYCGVPHGYVCQKRNLRLVCYRISEAHYGKTRHGKKLYSLQKNGCHSLCAYRTTRSKTFCRGMDCYL